MGQQYRRRDGSLRNFNEASKLTNPDIYKYQKTPTPGHRRMRPPNWLCASTITESLEDIATVGILVAPWSSVEKKLRHNEQGVSSIRIGRSVFQTITRGYNVHDKDSPRRLKVATKSDETVRKTATLETTHPGIRLRHYASSWGPKKEKDALSRLRTDGIDQRPLDDEIPTLNIGDWKYEP